MIFYTSTFFQSILIAWTFFFKDKIPPFPTHQAIKSIENQLGRPVSQIFADISPEPIAAASLGQVYKGKWHPLSFPEWKKFLFRLKFFKPSLHVHLQNGCSDMDENFLILM